MGINTFDLRAVGTGPSQAALMQLGERQFTNGATRPVFSSDDGRQFVLDDDAGPVYRTRLYPHE